MPTNASKGPFKAGAAVGRHGAAGECGHINQRAWRFAHHPPHPCFRDHVWLVHGFYLCKGCTVGVAGIVAGAAAAWATGWIWHRAEEQDGLILAALVLPTLISTLFDLPRPVRHVSRFFLGVATASAFLLLITTDRWVARGAIVGVYFAVKLPLQGLRRRRMEAEIARSQEKGYTRC